MALAVFPRFVGVNVVLIRISFSPLSVFDDEDENKLSYTDIHMQYKKLVSAIFYFFFFWVLSTLLTAKCPTFARRSINITHQRVLDCTLIGPG